MYSLTLPLHFPTNPRWFVIMQILIAGPGLSTVASVNDYVPC